MYSESEIGSASLTSHNKQLHNAENQFGPRENMQEVGWSTPQKVCWLKKTCTTKCWNWENWCKVCFHQVIKLLPIFVCFGQLIKHGFSFALYGYVKDCCSDICIERRSAVWLRDEELTSLHSFCRDGGVLEMLLKGPRSLKSEICNLCLLFQNWFLRNSALSMRCHVFSDKSREKMQLHAALKGFASFFRPCSNILPLRRAQYCAVSSGYHHL